MFTSRYRYLFAGLLSVYTYINTEFCDLYGHFNITIPWYFALAAITVITFAILEAGRLIEQPIRKLVQPAHSKIKFPVIFFIAGGLLSTVLTIVIVALTGKLLHQFSLAELVMPAKLNLIYAWLVNLLLHLLNTIMLFFEESRVNNMKAEELKRLNAQAELQLIKTQLNPHFLFNNLNVLSALVMQNNAEANQFIDAFSKVYRYILHNHDKELVSLRQELEHIDPYIFLLKKRFGDALQISIDVPAKHNNALIIPAALQMLIENAIKHNVVSRQKPLYIKLQANGKQTIAVSNNLQVKKETQYSTEIGLQNIVKRYQLVSDNEVIINSDENEFKVTIPLIQEAV
jgi:sensor histidine kinase YesM